jgi:hypothetical protein
MTDEQGKTFSRSITRLRGMFSTMNDNRALAIETFNRRELEACHIHLADVESDLESALKYTRKAMAAIEAAQRRADAITPNVPEGYDTIRGHLARHHPDVPEGYDTVLGHLARHHPDVLDQLDYSDPEGTVRDGWKLAHLCTRANRAVIYVAAPACLQSHGIKKVRAYPISILEQWWV